MRLPRALLALAALSGLALAQGFPLAVKHELGSLELKAPARRVVALDYSFLDTLIALGVKPVGAATGTAGGDRGAPPYLKPLAAGVPEVGSRPQPSLEAMLSLRPDLILADRFAQGTVYPQLSRIAPTAVLNSRLGSYDDLMAQLLEIGRMVGQSERARTLFEDQARLVAKGRAFASQKAPAFAALVATPRSVTAHSTESFIGSLLGKLGRRNAVAPRGDASQFELSLEGLSALNPGALVLFTASDEAPLTDEWRRNPLWNRLEAVRRGRVYVFDRDLWTRSRGPIALKLIVAQAIDSGLLADKAPVAAHALR